jgi:hypothetical protein
METSVAVVTVSVVDPETPARVAEIVVDPAATALDSPLEPAALLIVAMDVFDDAHVTDVVNGCVDESV